MIITRTPLRISLGGGGTDAPSYYEQTPGFVLSAAIDKYVYIGINSTFTDDYFLKYSSLERAATAGEVQHRIMREALDLVGVEPGVEIVSMADIPSGSGLGSSGSFTVGLLQALRAYRHQHSDPADLAEDAAHIEIERLGEPIGKQDQYIAAFGGLTSFDFLPGGKVDVNRLAIPAETLADLEDNLLLFFTGYSRAASSILADQKERSESGDEAMLANLTETLELGHRIRQALEAGDTHAFGEMMHEHWLIKRARTAGMSNPAIDEWYEAGIANGAIGGKLVGAGAGGFLLFYARDPQQLRAAMTRGNLQEVRFRFSQDGSSVIVRS